MAKYLSRVTAKDIKDVSPCCFSYIAITDFDKVTVNLSMYQNVGELTSGPQEIV